VARDSVVIADRFQSLASQQSQAYRYLKEYGPFDVVNLDICDTLFPTRSGDPSKYYAALHRLAIYQMKYQTTPWLLFVTTQVEPQEVNLDGTASLWRPLRRNWNDHPAFQEKLRLLVPSGVFDPKNTGIDISGLKEEHFVPIFGIALGKWLASLGSTANPVWSMRLMTSYRYEIVPQRRAEMLSLAFQFQPRHTPPIDRDALSTIQMEVPKVPSELECALQIIGQVQKLLDADEVLRNDSALRMQMLNESADLLELAGFDRDKYLEWVKNDEEPSAG
jgi:hypothetical protein